jgi:hypothetical protein
MRSPPNETSHTRKKFSSTRVKSSSELLQSVRNGTSYRLMEICNTCSSGTRIPAEIVYMGSEVEGVWDVGGRPEVVGLVSLLKIERISTQHLT